MILNSAQRSQKWNGRRHSRTPRRIAGRNWVTRGILSGNWPIVFLSLPSSGVIGADRETRGNKGAERRETNCLRANHYLID